MVINKNSAVILSERRIQLSAEQQSDSILAPMIAIQIADFFILKQNKETSAFNVCNLIIWFVGFVVYRLLMRVDIIVGNTLPDMLITIALCVAVSKMRRKDQK